MATSTPAAASETLDVPRGQGVPEVGVPFGCGLVFPVSQGHNTGSHLQYDTDAWDFRMPEGTPVVAAQDGVVRMARGDSTVGGCDVRFASFANYVVVDHGGGTETQYLHFQEVVVKPGQRVRKGELLGYSGNTGWSCGAHLHFKVATRKGGGWNNPSQPARILGYGDPERGTLISAPACEAGPDVVLARGSDGAPAQPADGNGEGARTPRMVRAAAKVDAVVDAVKDAATTTATTVVPGSKGKR
ncbi:MAG: M23 family metallopeptidase [Myxococcaceae bacterium]|nr:M23 family metallopeptidase [Myxococcaceae bacterium]MCI0672319.1 M23 family metallopeptidase [Myxococcaceae bacterium]